MFKKFFLSLTVITLSTLTSFPAFADTLSTNNKIATHEFRYTEFKENIDNVEKLNETIKNTKNVEDATEVSNNDITVENTDNTTADNSNNTTTEDTSPEYISTFTMESTAYTGGTVTASGTVPVRDPNGISTIAVDSSVIPLGSLLYIDGYGYAIAADTGGAIHGNIIDLYLNSYDECINWGRQNVTVNLIAYPGQW